MMKTIAIFLFIICCCCPIIAQFSDSFDDGNFNSNPEWLGNISEFKVINGILQLNAPNASGSGNTSYLSVKAATSTDFLTTWRFWVQLDFNPSSSNFARIYLASNQQDLSGELNGYFIQVGESGPDDALKLFRQDGKQTTFLGTATPGAIASQPVLASVEVTRSAEGEWTLSADYTGGNNFNEEFSIIDSTYSNAAYIGVWCRYTATRSDAFFFDNFFVDPLFVDRIPPSVTEVLVNNNQEIIVKFNEPIESFSATEFSNYQINKGIGSPISATFDPENPNSVTLGLPIPLESTIEYTLTINGVSDLNQNILNNGIINFTYFDVQNAEPGDLIITEIFADPTPSKGLPEAEFFEIYNRSNKVIQLNELLISSGGTPQSLPDQILLPGDYITICDDDDLLAFQAFGPTVSVRSFPALSNSDVIEISNSAEELIFSINYEDDWYDVDSLSMGGVSLELIDLDGLPDCPGNWAASRDQAGGTPGKPNSAANLSLENIAPQISSFFIESEFEIRIRYNEAMNLASALSTNAYNFTPALVISEIITGSENEVILLLSTPIQTGQSYLLNLENTITDCIGNSIGEGLAFNIGLPEEAEPGDLLINEILFNPFTGGKDFVEIYNSSTKVIELNGWLLQNTLLEKGNNLQVFENNFLVFPDTYVVITSDPGDISSNYQVLNPGNLVQNDLPTLESREGNFSLRRPDSLLIDAFDYDDDLHFSLLENLRGVSLERLSVNQATQSRGNWHSAAESVGFASPTAPNSQIIPQNSNTQALIAINNPRFSPDNDGFEDVLLIEVMPDQSGYVANVKIFDAQGRLVKDLVKNTLLGNSELFKWDGLNNENSKARIGPYVVWVELFRPDGTVIREKKTIVVAGKL